MNRGASIPRVAVTQELREQARGLLRACEGQEEGIVERAPSIPRHDAKIIKAIRISSQLNQMQLETILGVERGRLARLESGWKSTTRHEDQMLDRIRQRAVELGEDHGRVFFLRLHRVAERQGPDMATVVLMLGLELS